MDDKIQVAKTKFPKHVLGIEKLLNLEEMHDPIKNLCDTEVAILLEAQDIIKRSKKEF